MQSNSNPLWQKQNEFLNSLPLKARENLFSSEITPEERAEIWSNQSLIGEELVNQYAWATPDDRAIRIIRHFSPIVEIGCGRNGYWSKLLSEAGVDVVAFDTDVIGGGRIYNDSSSKNGNGENKSLNDEIQQIHVQKGGPEVLLLVKIRTSKRNLLLCYPDESYLESEGDEDNSTSNANHDLHAELSLGSACLEYFTGDYVIHVGELFGDSISLLNAPYGRSSSQSFQERLAGEYHCVLKASLQNYLHSRDTISVWKRSSRCTIVFEAESDGESDDEEVDYKDIPVEERLPTDLAAPLFSFLLDEEASSISNSNKEISKNTLRNMDNDQKRKRRKDNGVV